MEENRPGPSQSAHNSRDPLQESYFEKSPTQQDQQQSSGSQVNDSKIEALQQEISKRMKQLELLETTALEAEKKYSTYSLVHETEPQRQLKEYKKYAEKEYAGFDQEVRTFHRLARTQEKKLDDLTAEMELITKEYTNAKTNLQKQNSLAMEDTELKEKIQKCKTNKITLQQEAKELQLLIDGLKISISNKSTGTPLMSATETIKSLESSIDFAKKVTGLTIEDYEIKDGVQQYTCNQVGKLGSIQYQLKFSTESDGTEQVLYNPIRFDLNNQNSMDFMKQELQFDVEYTRIFFWKMMTVLNKRKGERMT